MSILRTSHNRSIKYLFLLVIFFLSLGHNAFSRSINEPAQNEAASTIQGFVFDQSRNPINRVDVELLNENYVIRSRVKTDGSGRYQFFNVADGRYYVRVLPFQFNLLDQTQEVIVQTISLIGEGSGSFDQDFYLSPKKGGLGDTTTGVVFAQEVPKEAQNLYENALSDIGNKKTAEAMKKLVAAIKIFPAYYAASQTLGIELMKNEQYLDATQFFMRAAESNPKSSRSFYYMGFVLNKLGKEYNRSALVALEKASALADSSWEVAFLTGKIQREEGNFLEAEKYLLNSKKLAGVKIPDIHIELAQLYANDLKQYGKAADELEQYLKSSKKKDEKIEKQISDLRNKAKKTE